MGTGNEAFRDPFWCHEYCIVIIARHTTLLNDDDDDVMAAKTQRITNRSSTMSISAFRLFLLSFFAYHFIESVSRQTQFIILQYDSLGDDFESLFRVSRPSPSHQRLKLSTTT